MTITEIIAVGTEIITLLGVVVPVYKMIKKQADRMIEITDGIRCQLRTECSISITATKTQRKSVSMSLKISSRVTMLIKLWAETRLSILSSSKSPNGRLSDESES